VRCPKCGSDNPGGKKFCGDCGAPLANHCPKCGTENPPGKRFCGDCGAALSADNAETRQPSSAQSTAAIQIRSEQPDASLAVDGERKTVTALFADIKGSMELMEDLDPEEARAVVDPALTLIDGGGPSLRWLCSAIHRRWHFRAVRRAGGARGPYAARPLRSVAPARAAQAIFRHVARPGAFTFAGAGRTEHRRGGGPFDRDRRGSHRVCADWAFDQPGGADADAGAGRFDRDDLALGSRGGLVEICAGEKPAKFLPVRGPTRF
jgi:predicted nucleic acid-binding Zn ribbon protein